MCPALFRSESGRDFISLREKKIREAVKANYMMPEAVSSTNIYMQGLKAAFDKRFRMLLHWTDVKAD